MTRGKDIKYPRHTELYESVCVGVGVCGKRCFKKHLNAETIWGLLFSAFLFTFLHCPVSSLWTSFLHPPSLSIDLFRFVIMYCCATSECACSMNTAHACVRIFTNKMTNIVQRDKVKAKYEGDGKQEEWRIQKLNTLRVLPHECVVPGYGVAFVACSTIWVHFLYTKWNHSWHKR